MVQVIFEPGIFSPEYRDAILKIASRMGWMPEKHFDKDEYIFTMLEDDKPIFDILTDF